MRSRYLAFLASLLAACVHDHPAGSRQPPHLVFTVPPHDLSTGDPIAIEITALDPATNAPADYYGAIKITLGQHPDSGALLGSTSLRAIEGVATTELYLAWPGDRYTLVASLDSGAATVESAPFAVRPRPPTAARGGRLKFLSSVPPHVYARTAFGAPIQVLALDGSGGVMLEDSTAVTISVIGNASLEGTQTAVTVKGVAVFRDLRVTVAGSGYILAASAAGLKGDTTPSFTVEPKKLRIDRVNLTIAAGVVIAPISVFAHDGDVPLTSESLAVTMDIIAPINGSILEGTRTVWAVPSAGTAFTSLVATFRDLKITKPGTYRFIASAAGWDADTSFSAFTVGPPPTNLAFFYQPGTTLAGNRILSSLQNEGCAAPWFIRAVGVVAQDSTGHTTPYTGTVTLALGANPGGATLTGALTGRAGFGFADIRISAPGIGYTLVASAPGLASATSRPFDILPPSASGAARLGFPIPCEDAMIPPPPAGSIISLTVLALDDEWSDLHGMTGNFPGNTYSGYAGPITLRVDSGAGARLSGTLTENAVDGRAIFGDLRPETPGAYRITASAPGLPDTRAYLWVTAKPTRLVFLQPIPNLQAGSSIVGRADIRIDMAIRDSSGNAAVAFRSPITLSLGANPSGATLSSSSGLTQPGYWGSVAFYEIVIDKPGSGYTLVASSPGIPSATSNTFDVMP